MSDDDKPMHRLTTTEAKPTRERRVSRRMSEFIRLITTGECKTQKAACERVGIHPNSIAREMRKAHIRVFIDRAVRQTIADGSMRASARLLQLVDASSEHVSLDASKHMLALSGHQPPAGPGMQVNVNFRAGYVIDLSDPPVTAIDVTPFIAPKR